MKKLILFSLLFIKACSLILGQKIVNETYKLPESGRVNLNLKFADSIRVTSWDRDEIQIKVVILINNGKLNDAFTMKVDKEGGELEIITDFDKEMIKQGNAADCEGYVQYINKDGKSYTVNSKGTHWNSGNMICSEIYFEIKVPDKADLRIESISGNMEIQGFAGKLFAKTISGFVDLTWKNNKGADLEMKTISGDVFSNFDVAIENKKKNSPVGYQLKGKINGGGVPIHLESISGNVYLRKEN
ncbi:MAG: hypothetical protein OHK0057_29770 [Thermoflexibacter sp.]